MGATACPTNATNIQRMNETWRSWVLRQMGRHGWTTQADVVRSSTLTRSAISQWLDEERDQKPTIDNCRRAAEAFGVTILEALVAAGHITDEEARTPPAAEVSTDNLSTLELVEELRTRISSHLDQLDPPPPGRNPHPPRRASDVPDTVFSNADVDQTEQSDYSDRVQ